jgi:acetyl-CoA carboxylase biotin carboxylase subunit
VSRRFESVLIANRGEIAVRLIRACRELGIRAVAIYSDADRDALHVRLADEAHRVGPAPSSESYLAVGSVIDAARRAGADAIHPGYGFLAENAGFAAACEDAGIVFIGPRPATIELMGEKTSARREAVAAGVPVVPGTLEALADPGEIRSEAERIGYPLMLKAAAGGGGKGLRLVASAGALAAAVERARSEAKSAFGDDRVYLERALERPRHVEIQVLADGRGGAVQLFERECSVQRRHQKLIEESPSPLLTPELRDRMGRQALALVERTGYRGAGTLEFLVDADREPWFLEMNTRLQVEHPVTELVTGVDIVEHQIRIAQGEPLALEQQRLALQGHAIECRVYAEDPAQGFLPSPGRILALATPGGPGIRDDSGVYAGSEVPVHYDPMISKLCCHAATRERAIARMRRAVSEYRVVGIRTTLPFFEWALQTPAFTSGDYDTSFVERLWNPREDGEPEGLELAVAAAALEEYSRRRARRHDAPAAGCGSSWWRAGVAERLGRDR